MALSNPTIGTSVTSQAASGIATLTTGSLSPSSDSLLFVFGGIDADNTGTPTITITSTLANVGAWAVHLRQTSSPATSTYHFFAYALVTGAPGTGTITATFTVQTGDLVMMTPGWLTGQDLATPVPQAVVSASGTGSTATATLGSTPATTSMVLGAIQRFTSVNAAATITPGTGFTEAAQQFAWHSTYGFGLESEVQYKNGSSPPAAVTATALGTIDAWTAIAVEIAVDTGPHPPGQVTGLAALPKGTTSVGLTWNAPGNGGSAITDYEYTTNAGSTWTSMSTTGTTKTITGLTALGSYTFAVRAKNAIGNGTASSSASITLPTFYDDFSGGLGHWTPARWRSQQPDTAGVPSLVLGAKDQDGHLDGVSTDVYPPNDVFVGTNSWLYMGAGSQNYGDTVVRCDQKMDLTGSGPWTIDLGFVPNLNIGGLQGWSYLYVTDLPYAAPSMDRDNSHGPVPTSGFCIRLDGDTPYDGSQYRPQPAACTYNAGVEAFVQDSGGHVLPISTTAESHVVITFTRSTCAITADGLTWFTNSWTIPSGLTSGWVYLGAHNHASRKYTPFYDSHNAVFSRIAWYGSALAPQTSYRAPDDTTMNTTSAEPTGMQIGWNGPQTLTVTGLPAGVTSARLIAMAHWDANATGYPASTKLRYSLNGNTSHDLAYSGVAGSSGSWMYSASLTAAELNSGSNTIAMSVIGQTGGYAPFFADVSILVEAAATTLAVAGASQTQTAATVALTQHQVLAGLASSSQQQATPNVALTQHFVLAGVVGSSQTQTAAVAGALTQHQALALAASSQTQTADAVAIVQHQILAGVAASSQTQTAAAAGALTQHQVLASAASSQTQTAATVVLTQHQVLAVDAGAQTQATPNLSLSGSIGLSVAGAGQGQTTPNVDLVQHQALAVANASQTQLAAVAGALTQHYVLAGLAASSQQQAAPNVALTQHQVLVVDPSAQSQNAGTVTVGLPGIIGPAGSSQSQTGESPGLVQHQVLAVAGSSQGQAAVTVVLTAGAGLAVAGASQGQTAATVALTQHQVLVVTGSSQGQVTDAVVLTYHAAGSLVPAGSSQGQSAATVALVQHGALVVANSRQTQFAASIDSAAHGAEIYVTWYNDACVASA